MLNKTNTVIAVCLVSITGMMAYTVNENEQQKPTAADLIWKKPSVISCGSYTKAYGSPQQKRECKVQLDEYEAMTRKGVRRW